MKPVVTFLRERVIRVIIYLDDLLVIFNNPQPLTSQINLIQELLQALSLVINKNKSHVVPTHVIVFSRLHLSSVTMTISLPQEKSKNQTGGNLPSSETLSVSTALGHL